MKTPHRNLLSCFGFVIWGDLDSLTIYRDKHGNIVSFAKTYPDKPPSQEQLAVRQRLRDTAAAWHSLTPERRRQWELATRRAPLCMHGYNLFVHWHQTGDDRTIRTIQRQTKTTLLD
ncbi:MAG: hypothetical protein PHS77_11395 [Gallionellaceae bacterium]|nr:hypothetical protein [Gallionellaceae bacterium]